MVSALPALLSAVAESELLFFLLFLALVSALAPAASEESAVFFLDLDFLLDVSAAFAESLLSSFFDFLDLFLLVPESVLLSSAMVCGFATAAGIDNANSRHNPAIHAVTRKGSLVMICPLSEG